MNARFVLACAASGIALLSTSGIAAAAEGVNPTMEIVQAKIWPGDSITMVATCDHPEFDGVATTESYVLEPTRLTGSKGPDGVWRLSGGTRVHADAAAGPASVLFSCGPNGDVGVAEFVITSDDVAPAFIGLTDDTVGPGQEVTVDARCPDPHFGSSAVISDVVSAPDLVRADGQTRDDPLRSTGRVAEDTKPGEYSVSFYCGHEQLTGTFTVTADPVAAKKTKVQAPATKAQVPVKPRGAADTGNLAAADNAAAAEPATDGAAGLLLAGAGVLLAAGGAGVWAYRRRQQS